VLRHSARQGQGREN